MKIIILPGWRQDSRTFAFIIEKIDQGAICLDLPGFGKQPLIGPDWGVPEYSKWVKEKIKDNHGIILIGHSFGGRVATSIASDNPPWLKGLILSGSPSIYRPKLSVRLQNILFNKLKRIVPKSVAQLFFSSELKTATSSGMDITFRKSVVFDQTSKLKKISVPTLLIWGENDKDVPISIAGEINSLIKNSTLKIIDAAGHNSFIDNPDLFTGYVKNFIKNISNS